jgi:uncharacterized protein
MAGIIVQLAISWIIIWFVERRSLAVLGFSPTKRRLLDFLAFFLLTAIFCASGFLMKMYFGKQEWRLNPDLSPEVVWAGLSWNIKSVLFEELIFRGVLLYILIRKVGSVRAVLVSAIAFGIYHWFSFGVIGNALQMAMTFIITGAMGLVLAYGYSKTFSLYVPVGIHLGWNVTQIFVFSQGPIGNGVFVPLDPAPFLTNSYVIFFLVTLLPMVMALLINYLILKRRRQVNVETKKALA